MSINSKPALVLTSMWLLMQSAYGQLQQDVPLILKEKFLNYTETVPLEEIYIHTDREEYIAGEELFFAMYVLDRKSFKPSPNSRIAYIELRNAGNIPVVQKRILIDSGTGSGNFALPDTLRTGVYTIRAYTSWMKNFLPENCFTKDIPVYNLLSEGATGEEVIRKSSVLNRIPENLRNNGMRLMVDRTGIDSIKLQLNSETFKSDDKPAYIFVHTHGNINFTGLVSIHGNSASVSIAKSDLTAGINHITFFNHKAEPVAERFIYTPSAEAGVIALHTGNSYKVREKIVIGLEPENSSDWLPGIFSISVAPRNEKQTGIDEYMILGSEFGIRMCDIAEQMRNSENPTAFFDSILLCVSSNWIDWDVILSGSAPHFKYPMEKEYHFLSGQLKSEGSQSSDSSQFVLLCAPGKDAMFQYALTDKEGNFSFPLRIDDDLHDLIILPDDLSGKSRVVIRSPFSDLIPETVANDSIHKVLPAYIPKWSVNYQVRKLYGISLTSGPEEVDRIPSKKIRFYGKPDNELVMAEYISLPLMEEVFYEILPHVSVRKKESGNEIVIIDRIDNRPYQAVPCLMIDGVIISDPELIIDMDPELVEKIDVIREKYFVGRYVFPGIVNVITKTGDFSAVQLPDYALRMPYRIFDRSALFSFPDYSFPEKRNSRLPDYRNTLYWDPAVRIDNNGGAEISFWSSDNKSDYIINIQGITEDGAMISQKRTLRIN